VIIFLKNQINQIHVGGFNTLSFKIKKFFFIIFFSLIAVLFVPFFIIIRIISNFFLVRFGSLPSDRIGHFVNDVNLYISDKKKYNLKLDIFYLEKPVCNYALVKLFKNYLFIFPKLFTVPFLMLNRIKFLGNAKHNIVLTRITGRNLSNRDILNNNYHFNNKDILYGKSFLKGLGLNKDDKFVCLVVRDSAYLKFHEPYANFAYHNFRDCNVENFKLVSDYLTGLGYYVFRMGAKVSKPILTNNKKIINYATAGIRNEFLDIYLSAHCEFCISTSLGFDSLPEMFNKPLVVVSLAPIAHIRSTNKKHLSIFKHHLDINNKKPITLSQIFERNIAGALDTRIYKNKGVNLIENTPEEIKEATIEMLNLMKNNFLKDTLQDSLELKFWNLFNDKIRKYGFKDIHAKLFKAHIGENFLKKNVNFLN